MNYIKNPELDGDTLYYRGSEVGFLLIHGLTASTAEVRLMADRLHQDGYTVSAPLLPGHLTTPKDMNQLRWQDWLDCAKSAHHDLQENVGTVIVGGESMGALLALMLAYGGASIAGLLCYSPALYIDRIWLSHLINPLVKYIPKSGKEDHLPWKGYTVNPVHALTELHSLQRQVRNGMRAIKTPIAIFQSEKDQTVNPKGAQVLYNSIASPIKEIHWFNDSSHVMLIDKQFDAIYQTTIQFVHSVI